MAHYTFIQEFAGFAGFKTATNQKKPALTRVQISTMALFLQS